jgi:hypothetical protein
VDTRRSLPSATSSFNSDGFQDGAGASALSLGLKTRWDKERCGCLISMPGADAPGRLGCRVTVGLIRCIFSRSCGPATLSWVKNSPALILWPGLWDLLPKDEVVGLSRPLESLKSRNLNGHYSSITPSIHDAIYNVSAYACNAVLYPQKQLLRGFTIRSVVALISTMRMSATSLFLVQLNG